MWVILERIIDFLAFGGWELSSHVWRRLRYGRGHELALHLPKAAAARLAPSALRVGIAPLAEPPQGDEPDWMRGALVTTPTRLVFCGRKRSFALSREDVVAIEPGPPIAVRWQDPDTGEPGWLRLEPRERNADYSGDRSPAAIYQRLEAWRTADTAREMFGFTLDVPLRLRFHRRRARWLGRRAGWRPARHT